MLNLRASIHLFGVKEKLFEPAMFLIPSNSMELNPGFLNFSQSPHEFNRTLVTHRVLEDIITPIGASVAGNMIPVASTSIFYILCHGCRSTLSDCKIGVI
jgi:hypothetical protein